MNRFRILACASTLFAAVLASSTTGAVASPTRGADLIIIIGTRPPPDIRPPKPRSTTGMRMVLSVRQVAAGESFSGIAGAFAPGEYVTVWDFFAGNRKLYWLNGGNASGSGLLKLVRDTVSVTAQGAHTLCGKGERTKRVACARYVVSGGGLRVGPGYVPPATGPGYVPPQVGPGYVPPASG